MYEYPNFYVEPPGYIGESRAPISRRIIGGLLLARVRNQKANEAPMIVNDPRAVERAASRWMSGEKDAYKFS